MIETLLCMILLELDSCMIADLGVMEVVPVPREFLPAFHKLSCQKRRFHAMFSGLQRNHEIIVQAYVHLTTHTHTHTLTVSLKSPFINIIPSDLYQAINASIFYASSSASTLYIRLQDQ